MVFLQLVHYLDALVHRVAWWGAGVVLDYEPGDWKGLRIPLNFVKRLHRPPLLAGYQFQRHGGELVWGERKV